MVNALSVVERPKAAGSTSRMPDAIPPTRGSSESAKSSFAIGRKKHVFDPEDWLKAAEAVADSADVVAAEVGTATAWARALQANAVVERSDAVIRDALEVLNALTEGPPRSNDQALFNVAATALIRTQRYDDLRGFLGGMPSGISTSSARVTMLALEGDFPAAYELLRAEDSSRDLSSRGYLELKLGKTHDAVRTFRRAVKEDLAGPDDRLNLAIALWRTGSRRKAARSKTIVSWGNQAKCPPGPTFIKQRISARPPEDR